MSKIDRIFTDRIYYAIRRRDTGVFVTPTSDNRVRQTELPEALLSKIGNAHQHRVGLMQDSGLGPLDIVQVQVTTTVLDAVSDDEAVTDRLAQLCRIGWRRAYLIAKQIEPALRLIPLARTMRFAVGFNGSTPSKQHLSEAHVLIRGNAMLVQSPADLMMLRLLGEPRLVFVYDFELRKIILSDQPDHAPEQETI